MGAQICKGWITPIWEESGVLRFGNGWLRLHQTKYLKTADRSAKRVDKDKKPKATETVKESRR